MCLSVPMQVESIEAGGALAWVARGARREQVSMLLVGEQPVGSWVLVALGFAKAVLDEEGRATIEEALEALAATLDEDYDPSRYFADLETGRRAA